MIKSRHRPSAFDDRLAHLLIGSGSATRQTRYPEHALKLRRLLPQLGMRFIVTIGTMFVENRLAAHFGIAQVCSVLLRAARQHRNHQKEDKWNPHAIGHYGFLPSACPVTVMSSR